MTTIVLIRHVETDHAGKFCGHSDPDVNAAGEQRLLALVSEVLPFGIKRIYSSDLHRARRTATAIGDRLGVTVELRPSLREINFGLWEGLSWEEILQRYPEEARLWVNEFSSRSAPSGEHYRDFVARVEAEFRFLTHAGGIEVSAVVTHRGVMQYALSRYFGFSQSEAWRRTEKCGAIVVASPIETPEIFLRTEESATRGSL